jgi:GH25 family lysozyme M1 (1,4-beta-N-acetylmuramidase)
MRARVPVLGILTIALLGLAAPASAGASDPGLGQMGWSGRGTQGAGMPPAGSAATRTSGIDVSHWQGTLNWASQYSAGVRFAWIKATEGTTYRDPNFSANYTGAYNAGVIRGGYHFARPDVSTGTTQANYFADHGGGWSADGRTLPGTLDIEYNPYGATCYGKSAASMVTWIRDFANTYRARTGRDAVIYTTADWWRTCTGNSAAFGATNPLWIARYASAPGTLPAGWSYYTVWQYTDTPLDRDYFNGSYARLQALARG